jgi:hypothetical protein
VAPTFDSARDELYGVDPGEFVAARTRLAREARAEGDKELADEITRLRRPSVAAWSVDQAARSDPTRVARLFAAGDALGEARGGKEIRDAARRRRALIDELTDTSLRYAGTLSPSPETHRDAIDATWEAASIEPGIQPVVSAGHLDKELARPSGFAAGASGTPAGSRTVASKSTSKRLPRLPSEPPPDELARRRAQTALDRARSALRDADSDAATTAHDLETARTVADAGSRRVAELERELADARDGVREAARAMREAERHATRAQAARARAARQVEQAEAELDNS